jgi:adenosylcobinamide-phosphate synthase
VISGFWARSLVARPLAVAAGFGIDRIFGEPPVRVHPIVGFGSLMARIEGAIYADTRTAGTAMCALGAGVGFGTGVLGNRLLGRSLATAFAVATAVAGKMLADEALQVGAALAQNDLPAARERVISLVGRSTTDLGEVEISRAVIESSAENTVDAVIASLLWASIGGAPAVLAHRAINTLDAMVGHHSPRYENFGWASARLDDVVNWIPARVATIAVAAIHSAKAQSIWRVVRRDAGQHPSPNGGVIEAAYAAALGVRLGGTNRYGDTVEHRGVLGDGRAVEVTDISRAVTLSRRISLLCALTLPLIVVGCQYVLSGNGFTGATAVQSR